jgi:ABC-type transport system involved in multi-copper enzyme maturation permease subunit
LGVNLLSKELGRRTIYNILSKPVARWEFLVGKFFGLYTTLVLIVAIMCTGLIGGLALFEGSADWGLVLVSGTTLLELMVVTAVALFFSSIVVTPTLAGLFTAAIFVVGRSSSYLHYFWAEQYPPSLQAGARALYWIVPHLDRFNIANEAVYGHYVSTEYLLAILAYAIGYSMVLLMLSVMLFARREFT